MQTPEFKKHYSEFGKTLHAFIRKTLSHGPRTDAYGSTTLGMPPQTSAVTRIATSASFCLLNGDADVERTVPCATMHLCELGKDAATDKHFLVLAFAYDQQAACKDFSNAHVRLEGNKALTSCMTYSMIRRCYTHGREKGPKHEDICKLVALASTLASLGVELQPTEESKKTKLLGGLCSTYEPDGVKKPRQLAGVYLVFVNAPALIEGSREESLLNELAWPRNGCYWTKEFVEEWCSVNETCPERCSLVAGVRGLAMTNPKEGFFDPKPSARSEAESDPSAERSSKAKLQTEPSAVESSSLSKSLSAQRSACPSSAPKKSTATKRKKSPFVLDECEASDDDDDDEDDDDDDDDDDEDEDKSASQSRSSTPNSCSSINASDVCISDSEEEEASLSEGSEREAKRFKRRRIEDSVSDLESNDSPSELDDDSKSSGGSQESGSKTPQSASKSKDTLIARSSPLASKKNTLPTAQQVKQAVEVDPGYTLKMPTKSARWLLEKLYRSATACVEERVAGMHGPNAASIRTAVAALDVLYDSSLQDGRKLGPDTAAEKEAHLLTLVGCLARAKEEGGPIASGTPPPLSCAAALCDAFSASLGRVVPSMAMFQKAVADAGAAAQEAQRDVRAAEEAMRLAKELAYCAPESFVPPLSGQEKGASSSGVAEAASPQNEKLLSGVAVSAHEAEE